MTVPPPVTNTTISLFMNGVADEDGPPGHVPPLTSHLPGMIWVPATQFHSRLTPGLFALVASFRAHKRGTQQASFLVK